MIRRKAGWNGKLSEWVLNEQNNPREFTDTVCAYFAADAVKVMTGQDVLKGLRRHKHKVRMEKLLAEAGYKSPLDFLKHHLEEIPPGTASPGDVALLSNGAFGIFQGEYIYTVTPGGVTLVSADTAKHAFRVPE